MKCMCSKLVLNFAILFGGASVIVGGILSSNVVADSSVAPAAAAEIGKPAPAFTMKDTDGKTHSLSDFKGKIVVLEWFCPTCPYSGGKGGRSIHNNGAVKALGKDLKKVDPDVVYLLVDSSTAKMRMTPEELSKKDAGMKDSLGITAPILIDGDTSVAKAYGAKSTPHMYVIDADGVLRYQGAFSDQKKTNYVLNSVKAIKDGSTVEPTYVKQWGCGVRYK